MTYATEAERVKDYAFWSESLRGKNIELERDVAEPGYYRNRTRDGDLIGIAVWRNGEGDLVAKVGKSGAVVEADAVFCERYFAWCARNPVTEENYKAWCNTGRWNEDVTEARSNSESVEPHVFIAEQIAELRAEAEKWLDSIGGTVSTQEHADKASNFRERFAELEKEATAAHKVAKEPHLKAGREVDATWKPIASLGDEAKRWAASLLTSFLAAQRAKVMQEAAAKAATGTSVHPSELRVKAGTRGRGTHLRSEKKLVCTDPTALWTHYRDDPRIIEFAMIQVSKIAMAEIEAGMTIPGAKIEIVERAV